MAATAEKKYRNTDRQLFTLDDVGEPDFICPAAISFGGGAFLVFQGKKLAQARATAGQQLQ